MLEMKVLLAKTRLDDPQMLATTEPLDVNDEFEKMFAEVPEIAIAMLLMEDALRWVKLFGPALFRFSPALETENAVKLVNVLLAEMLVMIYTPGFDADEPAQSRNVLFTAP